MKKFKLTSIPAFSKPIFLFFAFFLCIQLCCESQTSEELSNIKVEELTDEQIRRFVMEADRLNLNDAQVEQLALQRGMNPVEVVKFKGRVQSIRKAMAAYSSGIIPGQVMPDKENRKMDSVSVLEQKPLDDYETPFSQIQTRNFGFDVFNNRRITFEPNLRIPTPNNYQLAADDELLIDVSGYSEASYRLRVSPEGIVRIPIAGPVTVTGLTIEQAKKRITQKLAGSIYTSIRNGHTKVEVNLGSIRSMKVTIIGEATMPGTYTLPSLATAYNALYACGGPGINGSFRNIQIIRNNATIATIDVYKYLITGSKNNDIRLMDDDVIKINAYDVRIELKGEVKKPGLYDVAKGESIGDVIRYAGGLTDNAYTARIQVFRNTSKERQVTTITESNWETAIPQKGDTYVIGKILNRFSNRISINGAVYRPGEYELRNGMTLKSLLLEADGVREDAFTGRATLHRLKDDLSPEIISFDIEKLLNGAMEDIELKREDRVHIFSKFDLKEGFYVTIEGEVSNPGVFLYEKGITVQDLVLMSGGLKEAASLKRVEISRRVKNANLDSGNITTAIIYQQDLTLSLKDSTLNRVLELMPFDEVFIHPAPGYFVQKNAVIEGEVNFSGKYTLQSKQERISDLVKRAGGLTSEAYLAGAVLVRTKNLTKSEQNNSEQGLINLLKQNVQAGTSAELLQSQLALNARRRTENVGIDLQEIMAYPKSEYDLLLNDGDTLRIPKQLQTVRVNGEVLYPALVRYDRDFKFKDYISGAGGFSERSSRRRPYVVYANGSVKGTRSFLFFKRYPTLSPGSEIFVPVKREKERLNTGEVITISATVITMLAIIYNIFGK